MNSWSQNNANSNGEDGDMNDDTDESNTETGEIDYKSQYLQLRKKLKFLIYENEYFQENLRANQERLLKATRDKHFLIDRLLKYEPPLKSSDEDSSSEEETNKRKFIDQKPTNVKRRKIVKQEMSSSNIDEKEAMIEKLQARMGSEMVTSTFSTVPQELFSNEPSMDSTYGEDMNPF